MKFSFSSLLVLIFSLSAFAQNSTLLSNYLFLKPVYNPATVGSEDAIEIFAVYRGQWVGINGAPSTQAFSLNSPLNFFNSSVGLMVVNELQGAERITNVLLAYSYKLELKKSSLSFGASGGIIQRSIDGTKLRAPEGNYESGIDHRDDYIPNRLTSGITGDINLGVYYQTRKLYAGASLNNLMETPLSLEGQGGVTELRNPRYYTLMAGYRIKIGKKLNLLPNVIVRTDFVNTQPELNAILQFKDNLYGGLSFRGFTQDLNDAFIVMLGFKIFKNLRLGYSYDFSLSSLNNVNNGSHEVYLSYSIKMKELFNPGKIIYNPRNL